MWLRSNEWVQVVVDIDGDGSFLMNCQELATAAIENMDIKMFILNNQHLGMVVQWEDRFYKVCLPIGCRILTSTACMSRSCKIYSSFANHFSGGARICSASGALAGYGAAYTFSQPRGTSIKCHRKTCPCRPTGLTHTWGCARRSTMCLVTLRTSTRTSS